MKYQNPVIVLPGITATSLVDDYPLKADDIWTMVFNKEYDRVALHPDDLRYEAIEPAHVRPGQLFFIYDDLIKALRYELSERADRPTPVFAYPYDWRMNVRQSGYKLGAFVDEVLARTRLLRHYADAKSLQVDLVGHSMGGLVICEYLSQFGGKSRVGKVATIGTPWLGSVEAVVKLTTGMSLLTGNAPKEREREAARVTPSIYQLMPSYPGAAVDATGNDVSLFEQKNMQASITDSLCEFVRLYSASTRSENRQEKARSILSQMLSWARQHRKTVKAFKTSGASMAQTDWLAIAGVGQKTRIQLAVETTRRGPRFVVDEDQFANLLNAANPTAQETGDGTVPLAGAIPPFIAKSKLVCVTESDLGIFELRDRILTEFGGLHGLLPNINLVQRLVIKHLMPAYRGSVWGRRLPGSGSWNPPIAGLTEKRY